VTATILHRLPPPPAFSSGSGVCDAILTILTEQNTSFAEFPGLGPVVELDEVVEGCGDG